MVNAETKEFIIYIRDALRLLFPDEMPRHVDLIEKLKTFDEYTSVSSADGKTSIHYSEFKPGRHRSEYYYTLYIGGFPNNVNSEGDLIAEEYLLVLIDTDKSSIIAVEDEYDDEFIPILTVDKTPHGRRRHALAARMAYLKPRTTRKSSPHKSPSHKSPTRKSSSQKGGARRSRTRRSR